MSISDITIKRPVFGWMMMAGLILFGYISFQSMGISQLPNVEFPVVSVSLTWEGAAPEVMESDVVDPVEQAIMGVAGIKDISSTVRRGQASVNVELELGRDVDVAVQEIQTKIAQAQRRLPDDIDPPTVFKRNPADQPILWLSLRGEHKTPRELMAYAQDILQDKFASISGVGEVSLGGFVEPNLRVWIDNEKLKANELTALDVINAITTEHVERPAGIIETAVDERNVRAIGEAVSVADFANLRIPKRGGEAIYTPVYLKDVAYIEDGLADVQRISRSTGKMAIGFGIRKQTGSNEVEVSKAVFKRLDEVRNQLPDGMEISVTVNRTKFVEESIHELNLTMVLSAIVTSLVCWLFLGSWTATFNILLAIPTSILGSFIVLKFMGFTLNTFTILGLSLAIGMVVDDAIMVLENITRYKEKGLNASQAASVGAKQIAFAALATTVAVIAIFLPVAFMTGTTGRFFYEFGVTITVAVAISLFEALVFTPMRFAQLGNRAIQPTRLSMIVDQVFKSVSLGYRKRLTWVLNHRKLTVIASLGLFLLSLTAGFFIHKEFVPSQDQSLMLASIRTPVGSSIPFTDNKFKEVEKYLMTRPEVAGYFAAVGGFGGGESNRGNIFINLKEINQRPVPKGKSRPLSQKELMDIMRRDINKIDGVKASMQDLSLSGFSAQRGFPIEISVRGPNWEKLVELTDSIEAKMAQSPLMVDVDTDYQSGIKEIRVLPDRLKAAQQGVSVDDIAKVVNALVGGEVVGKYTTGGRRYDIRVRLRADQRLKAEDIYNINVRNNHGEMVMLKDVVTIEEKIASLNITRQSRERAITVNANVAKGKSQEKAIQEALAIAKNILPQGYTAILSGSSKTFKESNQGFGFVFILGVIVAYMVLASQFNSYLHPVTILMALPFSISGALVALLITQQTLNVYSVIGILLLMGIVKKNSILLVEFTNQLRAEGKPPIDALLEACPIRLRPILMTSMATIVAAIPPALMSGAGAEIRIPMAVTIIGGVFVSTVLTLFVVPCVYLIFTKFEKRH